MKSLREIFESVKAAMKKQLNELQVAGHRDDQTKMKLLGTVTKWNADLGEAIKLQWGHKEFYQFVEKVLSGVRVGNLQVKRLNPLAVECLGGLAAIHARTFDKGHTPEQLINTDKWSPEFQFDFVKGVRAHS